MFHEVNHHVLGGQPRAVAISHAPPPIKPLKGSAKTEAKDPVEMSLPEYRDLTDVD